jgi:outer membrane protein TolC
MVKMQRRNSIWRGVLVAGLVICMVAGNSGCTRRFYRNQADSEVAAVLHEKDKFPGWKIEHMENGIYPDARARFADPTNPDRPPMPPEDPAAYLLGPNPQKPRHAGVGRVEGTGYLDLLAMWDAQNRAEWAAQGRPDIARNMAQTIRTVALKQRDGDKAEFLPPPRPLNEMPTIKTNPYLIRIEQAMELGLINSREFQTRREDLYLTALPVTRERFAFSSQYFAWGQAIRERTGANTVFGEGDRWSFASSTGFSKLFSTGALLLVGFANQTVVNLGNPANTQGTVSQSTIDLDIIQPLLRGGGRAATLEPLTQTERNLLYEIRDYARFRKEYFQYMIGGGFLPGVGVTSPGSLSATHPLPPGLNGGNPARPQISPAGSGTLFLGVNAQAPAEGYMPSVFKAAVLKNEIANVNQLEKLLELFVAYESGGLISSLQVDQVQLQLLQGRNIVLAREQELRDSLDNFKQQLGIPVHLPLELHPHPIAPITAQFERYDAILKDYEATKERLDKLDDKKIFDKVRANLMNILENSKLTSKTEKFKKEIPSKWRSIIKLGSNEKILGMLTTWRKERAEFLGRQIKLAKNEIEFNGRMKRKAELETQRSSDQKLSLEERQKLTDQIRMAEDELSILAKQMKDLELKEPEKNRLREIEIDIRLGDFELKMSRYETAPWEKEATELAKAREYAKSWRDLRSEFVLILSRAGNERFELVEADWPRAPQVVVQGIDLINAPPDKYASESTFDIEKAYEIVAQTALDNRLDLMNSRARVVDAWRQLRVFANSLLGTFTVAYHMDSSTPPDQAQPLAFQASRTRHQLGLNLELPLVRLTERNAYRASQIAYQRARRNLDQQEDEIVNQVRSEIRLLQVLAKNLKIQQKAVELQYQQVESSLETFRAPQVPGEGANAAAAAALTQQLLNAYRGLPTAQNALLRTWIDYQVTRQQLYLDMELMPLDARGVWLDEFTNDAPGNQPRQPERPGQQSGTFPDLRGAVRFAP